MEKLLCPSMMCADYGCLAEEIKALVQARVEAKKAKNFAAPLCPTSPWV